MHRFSNAQGAMEIVRQLVKSIPDESMGGRNQLAHVYCEVVCGIKIIKAKYENGK